MTISRASSLSLNLSEFESKLVFWRSDQYLVASVYVFPHAYRITSLNLTRLLTDFSVSNTLILDSYANYPSSPNSISTTERFFYFLTAYSSS